MADLTGAVVTPSSIAGWMELQRRRQEESDRMLARSLTPLLYGATPETTQAEIPATPPVNVTTLRPGEDPEAAAMIPTVPGQPAQQETISAHTPASLTNAVGGAGNFATLARTPEGAAAINFMQPIAPEELQRRKDRQKGLMEFRQHSQRERDLYTAGDVEGGALAHMAGLRALMESVDDPTKITPQYERATERWRGLRNSSEQKQLAEQDMKAITKAQVDLNKNPDDPASAMNYVSTLMGAKSDYGQNLAAHLVPEAFKHAEQRAQESRLMHAFDVIWAKDIWPAYSTAQGKGITPDLGRLSQDALQRHPQEASYLQSRAWQDPKKIPDFFWNVLFPDISQSAPKNDREIAMRSVESDPVKPLRQGQPGYWDAVAKKYAELERLKKRSPEQERAFTDSQKALAAARNARAAASKESGGGTGKPLKGATINELTLSMNRLKQMRASPDLTEDDRVYIDQEVADLQSVLDVAIKRQRAPGAEATAAAPKTRRVPKVGGKTIEVTEPPAEITEDAALEEGQRLMKQYGLTKSQVIDGMKRAGWDVQ